MSVEQKSAFLTWQNILYVLEDEARVQSSMPKPMKSFSESRKSDRSLVTGKAAPVKEATPLIDDTAVDVGGKDEGGAALLPKGSPRNVDILKKLGTRERGRGKTEKKATGKK